GGKAWGERAGEKGEEEQEGGHAEPVAELGRHGSANSIEMDKQVACEQQRERSQHRQVASIASGEDFAGDDASEYRREGEIEKRRDFCIEMCREQDGKPPHRPQQQKDGQRCALERHPASPLGDRSEQEAGDNRRAVAENHFMDVPGHGREYCRDLIFSREGREPDQNGEGGPERTEKKKWPKARREQSGAGCS